MFTSQDPSNMASFVIFAISMPKSNILRIINKKYKIMLPAGSEPSKNACLFVSSGAKYTLEE